MQNALFSIALLDLYIHANQALEADAQPTPVVQNRANLLGLCDSKRSLLGIQTQFELKGAMLAVYNITSCFIPRFCIHCGLEGRHRPDTDVETGEYVFQFCLVELNLLHQPASTINVNQHQYQPASKIQQWRLAIHEDTSLYSRVQRRVVGEWTPRPRQQNNRTFNIFS